jgi:hypothetical protein
MTTQNNQQISGDVLVALLTAAATAAAGGPVRILSIQDSNEYSKYMGWVHFGRLQQFQVSRGR